MCDSSSARKEISIPPPPKIGTLVVVFKGGRQTEKKGVQLGWKLGRQHPGTSHLYFEVAREAEEECVPLITMNSSGPGPGKV